MERIIKNTRHKFIATIVLVVVAVVAISWGILQVYNQREIASPAEIAAVHELSKKNEAFAIYLEDQKEFEAHFVALATDIKNQESARVTRALAVTSIAVVIVGIGIAYLASRKLMKPVIEAYESQERFVQDAAHELRNPLAAMTVALQQANPSQSKTPLVRTFRRQTKRLIHINEDLLFLERRSKQEPAHLNVSELLEDVTEELQPIAHKKDINLIVKTDANIHKTMVANDYVRLTKNIIDNAVKYSKSNSTVYVTQRKNKNSITIIVKDSGIGIPKKDTEHIGSRFFRASNTGTIDGTGLGLAIVQKILNSYGGTIDISSVVNKGTTVIIHL